MKTKKTPRPAAKKRTKKKSHAGKSPLLAIAAKIRGQVARADVGPSWREMMMASMVRDDHNTFTIKAAKLQRDNGAMSRENANAMIADIAFQIVYDRYNNTDSELVRINRAERAAEKKHGLKAEEGYYWPIGQAPDDVEKLRAARDRRVNILTANVLKEYGEDELAVALLADADAFYKTVFHIDRKKPWRKPGGDTGS